MSPTLSFRSVDRILFKTLGKIDTLRYYQSDHFLGSTVRGNNDEIEFMRFKFEDKSLRKLHLPADLSNFEDVEFQVSSDEIEIPRESWIRHFFSVL